ncbi:MAG: inorganic phosphate transporter [Alphaproteobacteria bacterium]|nr:inorganic phosphate transporter [Alphaproteobacteria bacterium]
MIPNISFLVVATVAAGVAFDFVNGFHDASNSIATIVATRVLKPRQAVLWAAFFNVVAAFFFGTGVAKMVGSGMIALDFVTPLVVLCGLIGATIWGLMTWRLGLPSSSSHALMGGFAGSAMANSVMKNGWGAIGDPILAAGWTKVLAFIVLAPIMGLVLSFALMKALRFFDFKTARQAPLPPLGGRGGGVRGAVGSYVATPRIPSHSFLLPPSGGRGKDSLYRRGQLLSSAFLSLMHGSNDAQKTAGIITGALVSAKILPSFDIPLWVLGLSYATMGLGTLLGGWRIVRTMGHRLTRLKPEGGVCAESAAALSILFATLLNLPVSTTHVTTGAILGVGAATDPQKVHWSVGRRIAWAWVVTIPMAAFVSGCIMAAVVAQGG